MSNALKVAGEIGAGVLGWAGAAALAPEAAGGLVAEILGLGPEVAGLATTALQGTFGSLGAAEGVGVEKQAEKAIDIEQDKLDVAQQDLSQEQQLNDNVSHLRSLTQQPPHARPNNFAGLTRIETSSQPQVATYKMSSLQSGAKGSDRDVYVSYQAPPVSYFDNVNQHRGETLLAQAEYAIQQLKQSGEYQRAKRVYHISGGSKIGDEVARRMATTHNEVPTQVIT